jgi:hypothetical protein
MVASQAGTGSNSAAITIPLLPSRVCTNILRYQLVIPEIPRVERCE